MYLHNFASWAAARAIQNPNLSGTKSRDIKNAIDKIDLFAFVKDPGLLEDYKSVHTILVPKLMKAMGWSSNYYGVAAKVIAIYFKVTLVIPKSASKQILQKIYPPLDAFNIRQMLGRNNSVRWTSIDKINFNKLLKELNTYCDRNNVTFFEFESNNPLNH